MEQSAILTRQHPAQQPGDNPSVAITIYATNLNYDDHVSGRCRYFDHCRYCDGYNVQDVYTKEVQRLQRSMQNLAALSRQHQIPILSQIETLRQAIDQLKMLRLRLPR